MDRLSKKCLIAAGILHGTLVLMLLLGSGFRRPASRLGSSEVLTILPAPQGSQAPPAPNPAPVNVMAAKNIGDVSKPVQRTSLPERRHPKTGFELKALTSPRPRALGAAATHEIENTIDIIRRGASDKVEIGPVGDAAGPGMDSLPERLRSIYFNGWHEPAGATVDGAVVKATVTIAGDGTVISARITTGSGDPVVDQSVQRVLDEVTSITPFPRDAKGKQRTYLLGFSLKARRGSG